MSEVRRLLAAQASLFGALDPELPSVRTPPAGTTLVATDGRVGRFAGTVITHTFPPGTLGSLWSAHTVHELTPVVGDDPDQGMRALITSFDEWLAANTTEGESSALVIWPSRAVASTRALLEAGFTPLSVVGVRRAATAEVRAATGITIRPATTADLDELIPVAMAEHDFAVTVGGAFDRPDARELRRSILAARLARRTPIWVALQRGVIVGMAECDWTDVTEGTWSASKLKAGRWAHISSLSVLPGARGRGIGAALVGTAHQHFAEHPVYLYYHLTNPLSSVFWPRRGYRPLWTSWEKRSPGTPPPRCAASNG